MEAKPGEVVSDGKNVWIGAPVARAFAVPTEDNPTPDGVDSKDDEQEDR